MARWYRKRRLIGTDEPSDAVDTRRSRAPYPQTARRTDIRAVVALVEEETPIVHEEPDKEDTDNGAHQGDEEDFLENV